MNILFIWSFRMSKKELIIIAAGAAAFIIAAILLIGAAGSRSASASLGQGYTVTAVDEPSRAAFLRQFGWQTDPEPVSVREVTLPSVMDEALAEYNQIQLRQGFDLTSLCGKRIKLWTYNVTNYPAGGKAVANLMIKDGIVVGGDISSTRTDGFSHGFDPALFSAETAAAQAQMNTIDRSVPDRIPADEHVPPEQDGDEEDVGMAQEQQ